MVVQLTDRMNAPSEAVHGSNHNGICCQWQSKQVFAWLHHQGEFLPGYCTFELVHDSDHDSVVTASYEVWLQYADYVSPTSNVARYYV